MPDSIIKKIWRDLVERKGRTALTLLGLAIGLWGVASVAVAWFILGHDLSANFLSTNPPAIAMTIDADTNIDTEIDVAAIGTIEGADQLENRPQLLRPGVEARPQCGDQPGIRLVARKFLDFVEHKDCRFPSGPDPPEQVVEIKQDIRGRIRAQGGQVDLRLGSPSTRRYRQGQLQGRALCYPHHPIDETSPFQRFFKCVEQRCYRGKLHLPEAYIHDPMTLALSQGPQILL